MAKQWIAVDFDHVIRDDKNEPIEGVQEALAVLHEQGIGVLIHSCNRKPFIEQWMRERGIVFDDVWDEKGKPACALYVDDRGYRFTGDWPTAMRDILERVSDRPVRR